jgi:hypothetical protein
MLERLAMLFRPLPENHLEGISALLETWNAEADGFRAAALAARHGESPSSVVVAAADETHGRLLQLIEDIDQAMGRVPPGHQIFASLLQAQLVATNLLESISNSLDVLERFTVVQMSEPKTIAHEPPRLLAAE